MSGCSKLFPPIHALVECRVASIAKQRERENEGMELKVYHPRFKVHVPLAAVVTPQLALVFALTYGRSSIFIFLHFTASFCVVWCLVFGCNFVLRLLYFVLLYVRASIAQDFIFPLSCLCARIIGGGWIICLAGGENLERKPRHLLKGHEDRTRGFGCTQYRAPVGVFDFFIFISTSHFCRGGVAGSRLSDFDLIYRFVDSQGPLLFQ